MGMYIYIVITLQLCCVSSLQTKNQLNEKPPCWRQRSFLIGQLFENFINQYKLGTHV